MRILVTGVCGFVGHHLAGELTSHGHTVLGFDRPDAPVPDGLAGMVSGDLCESDALAAAVADLAPDACIHLAALSFVPEGETRPARMLSVNISGTMNLLDALRTHAPGARVLGVSTAQVYGPARREAPIREDDPLAPVSMYGISKAAADLATLAYARQFGLAAMTARPNNHVGPGQSPRFVVAAMAQQVKAMARGETETILRVGNLDSERDFSDVRDVVRAYRLLIENGRAGQAYNIAAGVQHKIRELVEALCARAGVTPEISVDAARFRPTDESPHLDISRIEHDVAWHPEIPFTQTVHDILESL